VAAILATSSMLVSKKKKSTATSPNLHHVPCLLMQLLLDLWIFRILASLLGVFHLIIQQFNTAISPCRGKNKEVIKYGHDIHSEVYSSTIVKCMLLH
jgi:hypothetical protein